MAYSYTQHEHNNTQKSKKLIAFSGKNFNVKAW